jgi:PAS domain S-box-containing protein
MPITVERKINLGFGLAFLLLAVLGWQCYRSTRETLDTTDWIAHTQEVLAALSSLDSDVTDLRLQKRVYLLTGQEAAQRAALAALQTCTEAVEPVEQLTADNPRQQARVQQLRPLLEQVRAFLSNRHPDEAAGAAALERMAPFVTRVHAILREMEQEERSLLDERRGAARQQARFTFAVVVLSTFFASLVAVATLAFIHRDMRHRRRAEELLRLNEARTRQIVDTANDAFILIDSQSKVVDWNRQAETTFGWLRREALGRSLTELIVPPQHRAGHLRGLAHYLKTGEGPILNRRIELTALRRDGA